MKLCNLDSILTNYEKFQHANTACQSWDCSPHLKIDGYANPQAFEMCCPTFTEVDSNFMIDPKLFTGPDAFDDLFSYICKQCKDASFGIQKIHNSCYKKPDKSRQKSPKIIARLSIACNRNRESIEELILKGKDPKYKTERPISASTRCPFCLDFICAATTNNWYLIRPNVPPSWIPGQHQFHPRPSQESVPSKLNSFTGEHLHYLESLTKTGQFTRPQMTIAFNNHFDTSYSEFQIR